MTPLEIAAKARWESRAEGNFPHRWEDFTDEGRKAHMEDMRAALLALAEAKLPVNIIGAGAAKIGGVRAEHGDGRHLLEARAAFPAMCRAIAEDRGEKPQEPEAA